MILWLVGMMGSGKTTVGMEVARRVGVEFIDTDLLITSLGGRSIPDIWSEDGEEAFRSLERNMIASAASATRAVVATGGGVVLSPENVDTMRAAGPVVWLNGSPTTLAQRVGHLGGRPLLAGEREPAAVLAEILDERRAIYEAAADHVVVTDDREVTDIAEEVLQLWNAS